MIRENIDIIVLGGLVVLLVILGFVIFGGDDGE